jgi:sRNA-binding regulator protein Hfq
MLKIELEIRELDYENLLENLLPLMEEQLRASGNPLGMLLSNGMSAGMAKKIISGLPQSQVDQLVADVINGNSKKLIDKAEDAAREKNINIKVGAVRASAK